MKIEDQVVSLELAKELKELGIPQKSLFYITPNKEIADKERIKFLSENIPFELEYYSAFTVAELGEMLPMEIKRDYYFETTRMMREKEVLKRDHWLCGYYKDHKKYFYQVLGYSEADARAKLLLYLIENKLI
jgi:hypothetical protein